MEAPALIRDLQNALSQPLPGPDAQLRMAHIDRRDQLARSIPNTVRHAAVIVLLFERNTEWHTVLIRRKSISGDVHSGQFGLPGGRLDGSETPEQGALREAYEEIGARPEKIETLGRMTNLHVPVSNHLVFPIVGFLSEPRDWILQESEVDMVLEIPVRRLLDPGTLTTTKIRLSTGLVIPKVPAFDIDGQIVWGATAMILGEFVEIIEPIVGKEF